MFVKNPLLSKEENQALHGDLRPTRWEEYIGQEKVKSNLRVMMDSARQRGEALDHLLFYGNSGLGKTSLANVVANEMGISLKRTSGPALQKAGEVAALLTNVEREEVLFIDEIHRISRPVGEMLYSAMEEFALHLVLGRGPMARTMELTLPPFTLIGATTKLALLPPPFRNRFGAVFQLGFYEKKDIRAILERSSRILHIAIDEDALDIITERSRLTPRVANRILKRVRDFALVEGQGRITKEVALKGLGFLGIDKLGLTQEDRNILLSIAQKFSGGPVGIEALAAAAGEEVETILDIYEPYLLQIGFLERTPRGRILTELARRHLPVV